MNDMGSPVSEPSRLAFSSISISASAAGTLHRCAWCTVWLPTMWPSSTARAIAARRRSWIGFDPFTRHPVQKNRPCTWCLASVSRMSGVVSSCGPSSNVNTTSGSPLADGPAAGCGQFVRASAGVAADETRIAVAIRPATNGNRMKASGYQKAWKGR
jgi:hypothetical protein